MIFENNTIIHEEKRTIDTDSVQDLIHELLKVQEKYNTTIKARFIKMLKQEYPEEFI